MISLREIRNLKKLFSLKSCKGTSIVIFAFMLTAIAGFSAVTIDVGAIVVDKSKLSSAVDSSAFAGAQEMVAKGNEVRGVVNNYLYKNIGALDHSDVLIDNNGKFIEVSAVKRVDSYFAKILGRNFTNISSVARVQIENIKSINGARPIAVVQQNFVYGKVYTLKEGGGDGYCGNYAGIALGGSGGSVYRDNLLYGYGGTISVNDQIQTETGNIAGTTVTAITQLIHGCTHTPECTYSYYNKNCSRIIYIPVVNTLTVNGKKYVKVLGFATFFLEGVTDHAGKADVIGRFITYCMQGETASDINDYGTYGLRLVK